jgi:hypothetical protein
MRFISLEHLWRRSWAALLRFPLSILSAAIGVTVAIYLIEMEGKVGNVLPYINLLLAAALGIPLFSCAAILSERWDGALVKWGSALAAMVLLVLIYLSLPGTDETHNTTIPYVRYGLFNVIVHLLVSFAPFVRVRQLNGFWNYNKGLFIRIVTAGLYSGVLFAGLALAIVALNELFDMDIDEKRFPELFIIIMGVFNTWFFVAGIPKDLDALEEVREYPNGLKVFTQYILLPLLLLYLVILYGYGTKILLAWDWPRGIVAYMISCIAVLGIFTLLLIHPYGGQQGNGWIRKVGLGYYWALFPLIGLLFIAIWLRLDDYGITVNRYAVVVLGIWLTVVAVYFAVMRGENIKLIPVTLALMLGLTSFGPWGMFAVGERSQVGRLEQLLTSAGILKDGKVQQEAQWKLDEKEGLVADSLHANNTLLADSLNNEVISILNYLDNHHGFAAIRPWFDQDMDSLITLAEKKNTNVNEARIYMQTMGLSYEYRSREMEFEQMQFSATALTVTPIGAYDYMVDWSGGSDGLIEFELDGTAFTWTDDRGVFTLSSATGEVKFALDSLAKRLAAQNGQATYITLDQQEMTLRDTLGPWNVVLDISYIYVQRTGNMPQVTGSNGVLFFGRKDDGLNTAN